MLHAQVATTPTPPAIAGAERGRGRGGGGGGAAAEPDSAVAEVLENTLWNRQLGVMSEEIVAALVCQIFEGAPALCAHIVLYVQAATEHNKPGHCHTAHMSYSGALRMAEHSKPGHCHTAHMSYSGALRMAGFTDACKYFGSCSCLKCSIML